MMIHALDLHGCSLVTPRQRPADIWHDLDLVRGLRRAARRIAPHAQIGLTLARQNDSETPPRKRADVLLVERGLFESRARARPRSRPASSSPTASRSSKASETDRRRRRIAGAARASLRLARRRQARRRAGALSDRDRGPCLPRRRRLHRRLHRGAARQRRQPGVRHRCRARPVASLAARPSQDRVDGRDRYPQLRGQAPAGAARYRRHRRQLHFAEGRAAGGAVAGGRADASAGADQAAIRGGAETFQARHHPQRDGASGNLRRHRGLRRLARLHRHPGVSVARSPAATAISNSSSARAVAERALVIDHVGHRGDGVAIAGGGNIYVPYTLGGETVEVAPVPGHHPDRRRLLAGRDRKPGADRAVLSAFRRLRRLRDPALGRRALSRLEARASWSTTLAQAGIDCEVAPLVDAHGAGRRRITLHARMGTHDVLKVGFAAASSHDIVPIDRCPILDPASERRDRGGLGARRAADVDRQAARHPGHRDRQRPRCRCARLRPAVDGA